MPTHLGTACTATYPPPVVPNPIYSFITHLSCCGSCIIMFLLAGVNCATSLSASTSAEPASASTTSATESTASGSHSEPYDLDSIPNLASLLHTHQAYQISTLMNSRESHPVAVKAVLVNSNDLVGLGNRVPAAVTGEAHHSGGGGGRFEQEWVHETDCMADCMAGAPWQLS